LRLFSLYQDWLEYQNPMKEWLNNAMRLNTSFSSAKAKRFLTLFPQTCGTVVESLGERPFHVRGPLNSAVLDAVMCAGLGANSLTDSRS
jgi:hypothetical protein